MVVVILVRRLFVIGVTFICVRTIQTSKVYSINDKKSNQCSLICCRNEIICIIVTIVISNM